MMPVLNLLHQDIYACIGGSYGKLLRTYTKASFNKPITSAKISLKLKIF